MKSFLRKYFQRFGDFGEALQSILRKDVPGLSASTFATVRHRQRKTKGNGSRLAGLTMVFKLTESAAKKWRLLNGAQIIPDIIQGIKFIDGIREDKVAA